MDQKLLQALNNVGLALESLVDALESKKEASTPTAEVMKSGNFGKQLEVITAKIGEIKSDTEKILKNQETIIAISKEKESDKKTKDIEEAGGAKKTADIKKGVATILLIAVAVLAIGFAFKLVGDVNVLSVIALALAITIIATAFEKVALMGLTIKDAAIASLTLVMISVALALSSIALSFVQPISLPKLLTAIMIAGAFVVLSPSIHKMIGAFKDLSWIEIGKAAIGLVFVMPAIALGIALASEALQLVKPIGLVQFFSAVMIAAVFAVVSYGIRNMLNAFKGIGPVTLMQSVIFLPLILPAIALGLALASQAFKLIQPIGLAQFFSAVMVGLVFVVLSFGLKKIIGAFKGLDPATAVVASFMIPILFTAMSIAIWKSSELLSQVVPIGLSQFITSIAISIIFVVLAFALAPIIKLSENLKWSSVVKLPALFTLMSLAIMLSSHILAMMAPLTLQQMLQAAILGVTLGIIALIMTPAIKVLGKLGIGELIKGGLAIVLIAGIVMVSSHILNAGEYGNYPGIGWIIGVALSLTTFGIAAFALGLMVFGPQALIFLAGMGAILAVAGTIVGVSKILAAGNYEVPGLLKWAVATALLYSTFTPIMLVLGTAALASAVISVFGPDPWKMAQQAMIDVAQTIVDVSFVLQKGSYKGGPTKEWAEGIAIALGAFSPVYGMLMKNAIFSIFGGGGVGPDDFAQAIKTVSQGIVDAGRFFASAENAGVWGAHPTKEWAEGVGTALSAFSPVYGMLMKNAIFSIFGGGGVGPEDFAEAIKTVSQGIIDAAVFFASPENAGVWGAHPTKEWAEGVGTAISAFSPVFDVLSGQSWLSKSVSAEDMKKAILTISQGIVDAAKFFAQPGVSEIFNTEGKYPSEAWGKGVGAALGAFAPVFEALSGKSWYQSGDDVIDNMSKGIRVITSSIVSSAIAFSGYTYDVKTKKWTGEGGFGGVWSAYPTKEWGEGVGTAIKSFLGIFDILQNKGYTVEQFVEYSKVLRQGLSSMSATAKNLFLNKEYFTVELDPNFVKNISSNLIGFAELGLQLDSMLVSEKTITTENSGFLGIGASSKEETVRVTKDMGLVEKVTANLVNVAKMLFFNRRFFKETEIYDTFYKDVVSFSSGIIWRFTILSNRLSIKGGFYKIQNTARNLVKTAKILYGGKDYFGLQIDPNYMKNVGQNIIDFNNLVKQLIESEGDKSLLDQLGDATSSLLGTDPISQIARRMITLAEGYDKLAESLTKLGVAMKTLNITDVKSLGGLTKELVSPGGVSKDTGKQSTGQIENKTSTTSVKTGGGNLPGAVGGGLSGDKKVEQQLNEIIKLLTNIDKSSESLDTLISQQIGDEDPKKETSMFGGFFGK